MNEISNLVRSRSASVCRLAATMVERGGEGRRGQVISAGCSEEGWDRMR